MTVADRLAEVRKVLVYVAGIAAQLVALGVLHGVALHWTQAGLAVLAGVGIYRATNGGGEMPERVDRDPEHRPGPLLVDGAPLVDVAEPNA